MSRLTWGLVMSACVVSPAQGVGLNFPWNGSAGPDWNDPSNWDVLSDPGPPPTVVFGPPGPGDFATLATPTGNPVAELSSSPPDLAGVFIGRGNDVATRGFRLQVANTTGNARITLDSEDAVPGFGFSELIVDPRPTFPDLLAAVQTDELVARNMGILRMAGGLVSVNRLGDFEGGGIVGVGNLNFGSSASTPGQVVYRGHTLFATSDLTLRARNGGVFDLDGTDETGAAAADVGTLRTQFGAAGTTLTIDAPLSDAYHGFLSMDEGTVAHFVQGWEFAGDGLVLNEATAGGSRAQLNGATTLSGSLTVLGDAGLDIDRLTTTPTATLTADADAVIVLVNAVTFSGGTVTGDGAIFQASHATATAGTTTISVDLYDLDGGGATTTTVAAGATLNLEAARIDAADDVFNGTLQVAGTFGFNTGFAFENAGTVNLTGGNFNGATFLNTGTLNVTGVSRSNAAVRLRAGSANHVAGTLELTGPLNRIESGASFTGDGTIAAVDGGTLLLADADLGGVALRNDGGVGMGLGVIATGAAQAYTQTAGGILLVKLAGDGDVPGTDTDRLDAAQSASLDGRLEVSLDLATPSGFTPGLGDTFTFLTAGGTGVTGQFAHADLPMLGPNEVWEIRYLSHAVELTVVAGVHGDYNDSGQVEQGDLDLVLTNWGRDIRVAGIPIGWFNDLPVGLIEQGELDKVLLNWGGTTAPDFRGVVVPEPAAGIVLSVLLAVPTRKRAASGGFL